MDADYGNVITDLQKKLAKQEAEVKKSKQLINLLCSQCGKSPIYQDAELQPSQPATEFAADEFYGQPLAGSMKKILTQRKAAGLGPATPREIYDVLVEGGFAFETPNEKNRLTNIRISLRKSSGTFHRLPNGKRYGLLEWYPKLRRRHTKETAQQSNVDEEGSVDSNHDHIEDSEDGAEVAEGNKDTEPDDDQHPF